MFKKKSLEVQKISRAVDIRRKYGWGPVFFNFVFVRPWYEPGLCTIVCMDLDLVIMKDNILIGSILFQDIITSVHLSIIIQSYSSRYLYLMIDKASHNSTLPSTIYLYLSGECNIDQSLIFWLKNVCEWPSTYY